ncbi:mycothiol transferase [Aquipuribacter sp. SD81]|uniref:mycothiol transferase n=1 Tax=Aquipuribacter sp. SD81 TaxID=3127703 RepID=UPI0030163B08
MTTQRTGDLPRERADLLESLATQRYLFRLTLDGLDDAQVRSRPTRSELSLGGLVTHVTLMERQWAGFVVDGPSAMAEDEAGQAAFDASFTLPGGTSLAEALEAWDAAAAATDELVRTVDLDATQPLPDAPWFPPGAVRSARRAFVHLTAEIAQHAGHADMLREHIDGAKTMG